MRGWLRSSLACLLMAGCNPTVVTDAPVPAPPPDDPQPIIDARGAPSEPVPAPAPTALVDTAATGAAPQTVELDINQHYEEQTDAKTWAKRFEKEGREVHDHRDEIIAVLALQPGMAVADVGAGTGLFTLAMADIVGPKGKVYAVDVQAYFLDHIGQKATKKGLDNVALVRASQESVGLAQGSIDLALMSDVYHHIEHPASYLASLHGALRPGGRLVIIDYRRIEGESSAWLLDHIRASPEQFRAEIVSAGFVLRDNHEGILEENFFFEFERM
ncbi:MAG: methyltransferase domain-containing protein [Deltaproteobacteria bacterium]|nr:methyltransferase domain-containing protein [Deltaproteobacteria bacterium]